MRKVSIIGHFPKVSAAMLASAIVGLTYMPDASAQDAKPAADAKHAADAAKAPPDAATKEAARAAYGAGEAAYAAGDYATAESKFKEANDLIPSIHARYWIGMSLAGQKKNEEALGALEAVVASAESSKLGEEKLNAAKTKIEDLGKTPAQATVTTVPASASISVDGKTHEGQSPFSISLAPGAHKLSASAEGYDSREIDVTAKPGETLELKVELTKSAPAAAPPPAAKPETPPPPPPPAEERSMVPAYVTLGIAGASAIVGTIFGIKALGEKSEFDDNPTLDKADDVERNALIADMAWGVTITLGITGIVLLTADDDPNPSSDAAKLERPKTKLEVTPYAGPKGGGAAARLTF